MSGDLSGNIDPDLARLGRTRNVRLAVPHFNGLGALLRHSELMPPYRTTPVRRWRPAAGCGSKTSTPIQ
jgi:LysR family transcriptional activator of mexEF-oprN operon